MGPDLLLNLKTWDYFVRVPTVRLRWSQLSPPLRSDLSLSEALLSLIRKGSESPSGAATALGVKNTLRSKWQWQQASFS